MRCLCIVGVGLLTKVDGDAIGSTIGTSMLCMSIDHACSAPQTLGHLIVGAEGPEGRGEASIVKVRGVGSAPLLQVKSSLFTEEHRTTHHRYSPARWP